IHVIAFPGDATGEGLYSSLDAQRIQRVALRLDSGFGAYPLIDPLLVGDVNGTGRLESFDALLVQRKALRLDVPEIPDLPPLPTMAAAEEAPGVRTARAAAPAPVIDWNAKPAFGAAGTGASTLEPVAAALASIGAPNPNASLRIPVAPAAAHAAAPKVALGAGA
ncbi:MAG TPA: hypothetical protein VIL43_12295, partial [Burkholderiales bacterium]